MAIEVSVRATSIGRPRTPAGRAKLTAARLAREYPGTAKELCELDFSTPWQLLVATVLSAQTTDERVNSVTPALFSVYPDPPDLAGANPDDVEAIIRPTGFFRVKSRTVVALAVAVCDRFACEVPTALEDLVTLPGVGRKTGNVVRSVAFGLPGLPVDTHVGRISRLLMLTKQNDPEKVEAELTAMLPKREWGAAQPAHDPARAAYLYRSQAASARVRAGRLLPVRCSPPWLDRPAQDGRAGQDWACQWCVGQWCVGQWRVGQWCVGQWCGGQWCGGQWWSGQ